MPTLRLLFLAGLLVLATLLFPAAYAAEEATPSVPGLVLPEPMDVFVGDQFVKIEAKCDGPCSFDVFSLFDKEGIELKTEQLSDKVLLIGIPNSPGVIRITAATIVAGKPSRIASTIVSIKARDNPTPTPTPVNNAKLFVTVIGPVKSATLEKTLTDLNCKYFGYATGDPVLARRKDLTDRAASVGGQAVIIQDEKGELQKLQKFTSEADVLSLIAELRRR